MLHRIQLYAFFAIVALSTVARAETITVATYNIENFWRHFPPTARDLAGNKEIADTLRHYADRCNWMISQVILDPKFNPDIMVIQECANQEQLDRFAKNWLKGAYETVIVFPGNSERNQNLALMMKPGFKVIEKRDQYYLDKDPGGGNDRGDKLFARGPAFVKVETPSGYQFWVGTTHQKSKSGNNVDNTKWRRREAVRTNEIMKELEKEGPADVILLGDMNDELGIQEFEQEAGGDVIATLVGPESGGLILVTKPLIDQGTISYGGYSRPDYRSFIDMIVATRSMKDQVQEVGVVSDGLARAASDHYPVFVKITTDPR